MRNHKALRKMPGHSNSHLVSVPISLPSHVHAYVADPLLPDDRGRRHLTMVGSKTEAFRPCRRVLTPGFSGAKHARAQGLARIEPSPRVTPRPTGLRTNAEASRRSGYDIPDPGLVVSSKRSPHTTRLFKLCQLLPCFIKWHTVKRGRL